MIAVALEPFEVFVNEQKVKAKEKEQRIVASKLLFKKQGLPLPKRSTNANSKWGRKFKHLIEDDEKSERQLKSLIVPS